MKLLQGQFTIVPLTRITQRVQVLLFGTALGSRGAALANHRIRLGLNEQEHHWGNCFRQCCLVSPKPEQDVGWKHCVLMPHQPYASTMSEYNVNSHGVVNLMTIDKQERNRGDF